MVAPSPSDLVSNDRSLHSSDFIRRPQKSFVGGCIWLYRARFDIIYEVSRLASDVPDALASPSCLVSFLKDAAKLMSRVADEHVSLKSPHGSYPGREQLNYL